MLRFWAVYVLGGFNLLLESLDQKYTRWRPGTTWRILNQEDTEVRAYGQFVKLDSCSFRTFISMHLDMLCFYNANRAFLICIYDVYTLVLVRYYIFCGNSFVTLETPIIKYLKRQIDQHLSKWAQTSDRKVLLLRGARQVGKTASVRNLALDFHSYAEVNFEEDTLIKTFFDGSLNPQRLVENLSGYLGKSIKAGETLVFFDEIQACPNAIRSLRFFYEAMPQLHVIAAGSLLEFALEDLPSYGVGRIRSLFMYPISFDEYLYSENKELFTLKKSASPTNPLAHALHSQLVALYIKYLYVGGMPAVISRYLQSRDLIDSRQIITDLVLSFQDDFSKYRKRIPSARILEVFQGTALQLGYKFVFKKAAPALSYAQVKLALTLLQQAGLVLPVTHTAANGLPLGAQANPKHQKMLLLDSGIALSLLSLNPITAIPQKSFELANKGHMAEMLTGLELIKYASPLQRPGLFYWQRQARSSQAEVDYLIQMDGQVIPVEVKSGGRGSMQSMRIFMKEKKSRLGIRIGLENFNRKGNIDIYPLYAVSSLFLNPPARQTNDLV